MIENKHIAKINRGGVTRHSGIDLLRIVAMFMVCVLHVNSSSGSLEYAASQGTGFRLGVWGSEACCLIAVNLYAMVTGYVCVTGSWKFSRYLRLWMQVAFYTVGGFASYALLRQFVWPELPPVQGSALVSSFLPVPFASAYWYFTSYTALFLLIPFINPVLRTTNAAMLRSLLFLLLGVFCLATMIEGDAAWDGGMNVVWLLALYVVGACFRLHPIAVPCCWLWLGIGAGVGVAVAYADLLRHAVNINYLFPPTVLTAFCTFALFEKLELRNKVLLRLIAVLAPLSFGVYLAHCHPCAIGAMFRSLPGVFSSAEYAWWLYLAIPLGIYITCSLLDACRAWLFGLCRANALADAMERAFIRLWNFLLSFLRRWVGDWFGCPPGR